MEDRILSLADAQELTTRALTASRTSPANAALVAEMLVSAEAEGLPSHGLSRAPFYAEQALRGKVNGFAIPEVRKLALAAGFVDAGDGFARPAIAEGARCGMELAAQSGLALIAIGRSHHFGAAGFHAERIARDGFIVLACGNTPAAVAPWGGTIPLYGTNPLAFACPRAGQSPLVIDLAVSQVARGKIVLAREKGIPIPADWALTAAGKPTTNPSEALAGTLLPMGGPKGAALALMVEILAAALTGANFGYEASSFFDANGPPSRVGQCFVIIDPRLAADSRFSERVELLLHAITSQPGARLPGARRFEARARAEVEGITIRQTLYEELRKRANGSGRADASEPGAYP